MNDQRLQDLCRFLSVAHHIPGRIRIRLDRSALSAAAGFSLDLLETFLDSLQRLEGRSHATAGGLAALVLDTAEGLV